MATRSPAVQFGWVAHMVLISSTNFLYSRGVADSASYSFSPRAMNSVKTGLLFTSLTPLGAEGGVRRERGGAGGGRFVGAGGGGGGGGGVIEGGRGCGEGDEAISPTRRQSRKPLMGLS